jgi:hypothetical protein
MGRVCALTREVLGQAGAVGKVHHEAVAAKAKGGQARAAASAACVGAGAASAGARARAGAADEGCEERLGVGGCVSRLKGWGGSSSHCVADRRADQFEAAPGRPGAAIATLTHRKGLG